MSDSPQIELPGQPSPPRLSDETVAYEMGLLQDARWCEANPAHAAALRASLTSALAATGQDQPPPADPRSEAQRLHDQHHSVTYGRDGSIALPELLAAAITREANATPSNAEQVAQQLRAVGLDPLSVVADAKLALEKAGHAVKAEHLSAQVLAQLGVWGRHLRKHADSRPQN
jgi:hypothetical protein